MNSKTCRIILLCFLFLFVFSVGVQLSNQKAQRVITYNPTTDYLNEHYGVSSIEDVKAKYQEEAWQNYAQSIKHWVNSSMSECTVPTYENIPQYGTSTHEPIQFQSTYPWWVHIANVNPFVELSVFSMSGLLLFSMLMVPKTRKKLLKHKSLLWILLIAIITLIAFQVGIRVGQATTFSGRDIYLDDIPATASYIINRDDTYIWATRYDGKVAFSGALADGNATIIQQTLNALTSGRTWKEKVVLSLEMVLDATIYIPSYTILELQGKITRKADSDFIMVKIWNVNDVELVGGIYDGNKDNVSTYREIVHLNNSQRVTIRDTFMKDHNHEAIYVAGTSKDIKILNPWFNTIRCCGIWLNSENVERVDIVEPHFYNHYNTEAMYIMGSKHVNVLGGNFEKTNRAGIGLDKQDDVWASDINIIGGTFKDCGIQMGEFAGNASTIEIARGQDINIIGATIEHGYHGVFVWNGRRLNILGNTIKLCEETGATFTNTEGLTFVGNSIIDNNQADDSNHGVVVNSLKYGTIKANVIGNLTPEGKQKCGIRARTAGSFQEKNIIEGNVFHNNTVGYVIYVQHSDDVMIKNNAGYNPKGKNAYIFETGGSRLSAFTVGGGTNTPTASTEYTVIHGDHLITCSGGTGVSITIKDPKGNTMASGLTELSMMFLPVGWKINFGAFSVAPTTMIVAGL